MNPDLRSRVPAGVLYVLVIAGTCLYSRVSASILVMLFFLFCLYEFVEASAKTSSAKVYCLGIGVGMIAALNTTFFQTEILTCPIAAIASIGCLVGALYLITKKSTLVPLFPTIISTIGYIVLPFASAMLFLKEVPESNLIILGVFIILWLNDAGAYFVGKAIGKRKLFESVSPNKSWEGSIGGGIVGILIAIAVSKLIGGYDLQHWMILSLIIWISGTYGDLFQSAWKRSLGLKDSGTLLKGHGGFLDRLDSFIYAIPFVVLYHYLIIT